MSARAALLAPILLALGCGDHTVKIPLTYGPDDVAVIGRRVDGRFAIDIRPFESADSLELTADDGVPIYTWILAPGDFVLPTGEPVPLTTLAGLTSRVEGTPIDKSGATGSCGRCLAPARDTPQVVNEGDACRVPPFVRGAIWQPSEGGFVCSGASDSTICSAGPESDQQLIEEVRRQIFLDWPGPCACTGDDPVPSLAEMEIRPISPVAAPEPINVYAQDDQGRIAGFSRNIATLWDPVAQVTSMLPIRDWPVTVQHAIALRDGTGFVVASEEFNTGYYDTFRFDRFLVDNGQLVGPELITSQHLAAPERMKYLGDHPDLPLYLIGHVRGNVGSFEPAVFACTDRTLACQQVGLTSCPDQRSLAFVLDLDILPNGAGFGLADHAFYYKDPNAPPLPNPSPADTWRCWQNTSRTWPMRGGGTVKTREFASVGHAGNRILVCGHSETAACTPDYAVVLSATVTASAGAVVDPEWEMVYRGGDGSRCRDFMRVPGHPEQTRLRLSGQVLVDFDGNGDVVQETNIGAQYGNVPGLTWIDDMMLDGYTLLESNESQAYLREPDTSELTQIYGGPDRALASYRSAVAIGEGDFLVFGNPQGILRARVMQSGGDFPAVDLRILADPTGVLAAGDDLRDAVVDSEETAASGMPVVMIAGERAGDTLLLRTVISDTEIVRGTKLEPPASVDNLGAVRIGEAAAGQFVVGLEGTRLLRVVGDQVTELAIDFDDPDTDEVEARPELGPDGCTGNPRRLDAWRDIAGKNGVAWVAGANQLIFRVTGDRVERFFGSPTAEYSSLLVTCPDRVVFAGRGTTVDLGGIERLALQFWSIDPIEPDPMAEPSLLIKREQALREIAADQVTAIGIGYIREGYPRAVLPDATAGRGDPAHRPYAAMLSNGLTVRFFAAEGLDAERPPFYPEVVVQSPGGYVLYGGWDSRLALGVPESKR